MLDLTGQMIRQYRIESLLGVGGMGTVYRAYDTNLERLVAIKLMHPHFVQEKEFRLRLEQEAKISAQLDHPSIVRIFDFGESKYGLYICMEYVSGGSLWAHLKRLQEKQIYLPLEQTVQIGYQIAEALHYAHQYGVVHRDVKPGNIILKRLVVSEGQESAFRAVLTDFGLVRFLEGNRLTQSGTTLGTPAYMSPEQCAAKSLDGGTDLYSLGVVLYELVTNQLPYQFNTLSEAINGHLKEMSPIRANSLRPDIPLLLTQILEKGLARKREERFRDGQEMSDELRHLLSLLRQSDGGSRGMVISKNEERFLQGSELAIETPGHGVTIFPLTERLVTIGRQEENQIILTADGVSRRHAQVRGDEDGWWIEDLGGVNGSHLNGRLLDRNESAIWPEGEIVQIGPYRLSWKQLKGAPDSLEKNQPIPEEYLDLYLVEEQIELIPGNRAEIQIQILSKHRGEDQLSVQVQGLPEGWINERKKIVSIGANGEQTVIFLLQPPRHSSTPTGKQRFRISVQSVRLSKLTVGVTGSVFIKPFTALDVSLNQRMVRIPSENQIHVRNSGNVPIKVRAQVNKAADQLLFRLPEEEILIDSERSIAIPFEIEPRRKPWFGELEIYPYIVDLIGGNDIRYQLKGQAQITPRLPRWIGYILWGLFLIFACSSITLLAGVQMQRFWGNLGGVPFAPTRTVETPTPIILASPTIIISPTVVPQLSDDDDGDLLSNGQELILGTDPGRVDSDGDGVSDWDELFIYLTNPILADSDHDSLSDGQEIFEYKSNPLKRDSDGDGVFDGDELLAGTDPLISNIPTVVPIEATVISATEVATASPTLESITPEPTELIPTETVVPTETPTIVPTITPTETPTIVPTITPIATSEPISLLIRCTSTPPTIDGLIQSLEWGDDNPLVTFGSESGRDEVGALYMLQTEQFLYLGVQSFDEEIDITDSIRLYFDTAKNEGDPDEADRFFQVTRDENASVAAGIGTNDDQNFWNNDYLTDAWVVTVQEGGGVWSMEIGIDLDEFGGMSNPFGLLVQILFSGRGIETFPTGGESDVTTDWQPVRYESCS